MENVLHCDIRGRIPILTTQEIRGGYKGAPWEVYKCMDVHRCIWDKPDKMYRKRANIQNTVSY